MLTHKGTQTIETERLILRRFELADADAIFNNWANDDEVTKYMRWETHKNIEETKNVVSSWIENYNSPECYHWGLSIKSTGQLIGSIGAGAIDKNDNKCEIGYCIGREFWSMGFTTEAVKAVIHFLMFDVGLNRVEAYHSVNNPASGKVMQKTGMTFEGRAKQKYRCRLGFQDSDMYGIVKSEFDS
jgi:ribosomal-protein-alanine N-acetyltransferase